MDRTKGPLFEVACHEGNYGMTTSSRATAPRSEP